MLWVRIRAMTPAIVELRRQGEEIRAFELRRIARCLQDLSAARRAAVNVMTTAIVNKFLHGPTLALREAASQSAVGGSSVSRACEADAAPRPLPPPRHLLSVIAAAYGLAAR